MHIFSFLFSSVESSTTNPFFKSPFLLLGITLGIVATFLTLSNATSVAKGKLRISFLFLGSAIAFLVLGILAVTLLPYRLGHQITNTLHDLSLVIGFFLLLLASSNFKKESARAENILSQDKAKSDFINVVSHHFRTPLSVIRWSTDLLNDQKNPSPQDIQEATGVIYENTLYLTKTLENVFAVFALEQGKITLNRKPILLWELVEKALKDLALDIKKQNISVQFNKQDVPLKELQVDEEKIVHLLRILLENAVHYSIQGKTIYVSIRLEESHGKQTVVCQITDQGIGISESEKPFLFKKFFRGKKASEISSLGTGLGLYIAKQYSQLHGGTIDFTSKEENGSTFVLRLPVNTH